MSVKEEVVEMARKAKEAFYTLSHLSSEAKDKALLSMAESLEEEREKILEENRKDLEFARKRNLSPALLDRLALNPERIKKMAQGLRDIASLPDPVGEVIRMWKRPNGLQIGKVRVPLGVIGFIYEARPNVTVDAAGLCIKSGNAVILKGGSEATHSNVVIADILQKAIAGEGIPQGAIQLVQRREREVVKELLQLDRYIDVIIPRGGEGLIRTVVENSTIPVIKHYQGICHTYVDEDVDIPMAIKVCYNAKVQRPGVCNAMETLLVHKAIAGKFLPLMARELEKAGVELRGCPLTRKVLTGIKEATEEDWTTEYLDLILSIKVVSNIDDAIQHINTYGSHHSDAIVTENYTRARKFLEEVDSATVYVNASTRFTDGGEFGLGAEVGISTDKLHARGPMGLEELTTYKYIIYGDGQVRE